MGQRLVLKFIKDRQLLLLRHGLKILTMDTSPIVKWFTKSIMLIQGIVIVDTQRKCLFVALILDGSVVVESAEEMRMYHKS